MGNLDTYPIAVNGIVSFVEDASDLFNGATILFPLGGLGGWDSDRRQTPETPSPFPAANDKMEVRKVPRGNVSMNRMIKRWTVISWLSLLAGVLYEIKALTSKSLLYLVLGLILPLAAFGFLYYLKNTREDDNTRHAHHGSQ